MLLDTGQSQLLSASLPDILLSKILINNILPVYSSCVCTFSMCFCNWTLETCLICSILCACPSHSRSIELQIFVSVATLADLYNPSLVCYDISLLTICIYIVFILEKKSEV